MIRYPSLPVFFGGVALCIGVGCDDGGGHGVGGTPDASGPMCVDPPARDAGTGDAGPRVAECPAGDCDLLENDCAATQGCYFLAPSEGADAVPTCQPAGEGADAEACADYSDCASGHDCIGGVCRKLCCAGSNEGCPAGTRCAVQYATLAGELSGAGYCAPENACWLVEQACCETDQGCFLLDVESGSRMCLDAATSANLAEGEECTNANDCAAGLGCFRTGTASTRTCFKFCYTSENPTGCRDNQVCGSLTIDSLPGIGLCLDRP